MGKLTVTVYLPAALREYDLTIPADLPLSQLTPLAAKALSQSTYSTVYPGAHLAAVPAGHRGDPQY